MSNLSDMYIEGIIPNAHLYDMKSSLYDIAKTTFPTLMLREHFRCVPSIIGYGNRLSYDYKIKPLRDDSNVRVKPATVAYRVDSQRNRRKSNEIEAKSIVCFTDLEINKDPQEKEADMFASYEALSYFIKNKLGKERQELDIEDVVRIEQNFGISRQAILWRLVKDGYLNKGKADTMKTEIIALARRLGYDDELYTPTPEHKQYATFGKYIKLAEQLKSQDIISQGKYEELLLNGFRSDIVYGFDNEEEEVYD